MSKPRKRSDVESRLVNEIDRTSRRAHSNGALAIALDRVTTPREGLRGEGKTIPKTGFASHKPAAPEAQDNPVENELQKAIETARQQTNVSDLALSIRMEEHIAERVHHYWLDRGYNVHASVQPVMVKTNRSTSHYRAARSTLVNGLPRNYRDHTDQPLGVR